MTGTQMSMIGKQPSLIQWVPPKRAPIKDDAVQIVRRTVKKPGNGKCVHCLADPVERNWDHMFPKSWYPDTTPENLEKWKIPSCIPCNDRYGKLERDLMNRLALSLDSKNPASAGLAERALRGINPEKAKNEGDAAARDARARKLLREMLKGEEIAAVNVVPGLEDRWNQAAEQQEAIKIPEGSLTAVAEKIVRGIVYREDNVFIEPPYKIECFLDGEHAKPTKEVLDRQGEVFRREPGLEIRRAAEEEDAQSALYEITLWDQLKLYASVAKSDEDSTG